MMAGSDGKVAAAVLAATSAAANIDLTTVPARGAGFTDPGNKNPLGHYVTVQNDGTNDVYLVFGPTQASVSGANAPAAATTGTNAVGLCMRVASGSEKRFKLPVGDTASSAGVGGDSPGRWMAYVCKATQTATIRVFQSSV